MESISKFRTWALLIVSKFSPGWLGLARKLKRGDPDTSRNFWDFRRPILIRWWEVQTAADHMTHFALPETTCTSLKAIRDAKRQRTLGIEERAVDSRRSGRKRIRKRFDPSCECNRISPTATCRPQTMASKRCRECTRTTLPAIRSSVLRLTDDVHDLYDRWSVRPKTADGSKFHGELYALVGRLISLTRDLNGSPDQLSVLVERYEECCDEYDKLAARLDGCGAAAVNLSDFYRQN